MLGRDAGSTSSDRNAFCPSRGKSMNYLHRNCFWARNLNRNGQVTYYIIHVKSTLERHLIVTPSVSRVLHCPMLLLNKMITFGFLHFSSRSSWLLGGSQKDHLGIRADNGIPLYLRGARPAPVPPEHHQTSHCCSMGSGCPGWRANKGCSHLLLSTVGVSLS